MTSNAVSTRTTAASTPKLLNKPLSFADSNKLNSASTTNLANTQATRNLATVSSQRTLTLNKDNSRSKIQPMNTIHFKTTNNVFSSSNRTKLVSNANQQQATPSARQEISRINSTSSSVNKSYSINKKYSSNNSHKFNFHQNTKSKLSSLLKPTSSLNKYSSFSSRSKTNAGSSILDKIKRPNSFLVPSGGSFMKSRSKMNNQSLNNVSDIVKAYTSDNSQRFGMNNQRTLNFTKNLTLRGNSNLLSANNAFQKQAKPDRVSTTSNASYISQNYTPLVVPASQNVSHNVSFVDERSTKINQLQSNQNSIAANEGMSKITPL